MDYAANPFTALSLIAAPAVLTNACSVLVMSTSNRLARTIDRARELTRQLEAKHAAPDAGSVPSEDAQDALALRELQYAEKRALMLVRALQRFYFALSGFAGSAFLSILGAVIVTSLPSAVAKAFEVIAVLVGVGAVAAVVSGGLLLVHETRIALITLHEQSGHIQAKFAHHLKK